MAKKADVGLLVFTRDCGRVYVWLRRQEDGQYGPTFRSENQGDENYMQTIARLSFGQVHQPRVLKANEVEIEGEPVLRAVYGVAGIPPAESSDLVSLTLPGVWELSRLEAFLYDAAISGFQEFSLEPVNTV